MAVIRATAMGLQCAHAGSTLVFFQSVTNGILMWARTALQIKRISQPLCQGYPVPLCWECCRHTCVAYDTYLYVCMSVCVCVDEERKIEVYGRASFSSVPL